MTFQPGTKHELTREDKVKGGKAISEIKRIANSLKRRKKCSPTCPLYPCSVQRQCTELGGRCAFKELPIDLQKTSLNILLGGQEGVIQEFTKLLQKIITLSNSQAPDDIAEARLLKKDINDYIKTVMGDKISHVIEEPIEIRIRWMDEEEEAEE